MKTAFLGLPDHATVAMMYKSGQRRKKELPESLIHLGTYAELERFVKAFAAGHINLVILVGERGLQKSRTVAKSTPAGACWIQGSASPFGMYLKLYQYRNQLVVIDDVDAIYRSKDGINLLKCLCQTEPEKTVSWQRAAKQLDNEGVPREFTTKSRVIIIANDWHTLNRNVAAVEDRGHAICFSPTGEEVHQRTGEWFDDKEIYDWLGERLHRIQKPSMRLYYRARELKQIGFDWKRLVPLTPVDERRKLIAELVADDSFETQEDRICQFVSRGAGCRATFFNHLKLLRK